MWNQIGRILTRDRKKPSQVQDRPLFLQCSPLFLRASVSSLLNKESIDGRINSTLNRSHK